MPEIGRSLRRERTRQGLSIEEASFANCHNGSAAAGTREQNIDRLPDRVQTLKALRHYADFLGLPGDRYTLVLIEHWPTGFSSSSVVTVHTPLRWSDTTTPGVVPPIQQVDQRAEPTSARTAGTSLVDVRGLPLAASASTSTGFSRADHDQRRLHEHGAGPPIDRTGPLPIVDG